MWKVEDHTADVRLSVEAEGWAGLLQEAVRAFASWTCGETAATRAPVVEREVAVDGRDAPETWVRWWRALHRLLVVEGLLTVEARLEGPTARRVSAAVGCVPRDELELEACEDVKAVTWHGAEAAERPDGSWRGTIVLDV